MHAQPRRTADGGRRLGVCAHRGPTRPGLTLVRSVLKLRQNWKTEEEVRLVFDRMQNDAWSDEHASLHPSNSAATRLSLPFDWSQTGVKLYGGPDLHEKQLAQIRTSLHRQK